jgi:hypothetical protein
MGDERTKAVPGYAIPLPPDTTDDYCVVCRSRSAPFLFRDRMAGTVERYCRHHLPDHFGLTPTLTRLLEDLYKLGLEKEKGPPAAADRPGVPQRSEGAG